MISASSRIPRLGCASRFRPTQMAPLLLTTIVNGTFTSMITSENLQDREDLVQQHLEVEEPYVSDLHVLSSDPFRRDRLGQMRRSVRVLFLDVLDKSVELI